MREPGQWPSADRFDHCSRSWRAGRAMAGSAPSAGIWALNESVRPRVAIGIFHDIARLRDALERLAGTGCSSSDIILLSEEGALDGQLHQLAARPDGHAGPIQLLTRDSDEAGTEWISAEYDDAHSRLTRDQILHFETWLASRFADDLDGHLRHGGCLLLCTTDNEIQEQTVTRVLLQHSEDRVQIHDIRSAG